MTKRRTNPRKNMVVGHLKKGQEPCALCCDRSFLFGGAGRFNDLDSDFGYTKVAVCTFCFGTGISNIVSDEVRKEAQRLRIFRDSVHRRLRVIQENPDLHPKKEIGGLTKITEYENLLPEEIKLLLIVRKYWLETGKPKDVYAEQLTEHLTEQFSLLPRRPILSAEDKAPFVVNNESLPENLNDLTTETLADLHDLVKSFGHKFLEEGEISLTAGMPLDLEITISTNPENHSMIISCEAGIFTKERPPIILELPEKQMIVMGSYIKFSELSLFIRAVDWLACHRGLLNSKTGTRKKKEMKVDFSSP
ncbi:MAG: hypothetical protein WCT18_02155 [Patescibacteria group bacterium]